MVNGFFAIIFKTTSYLEFKFMTIGGGRAGVLELFTHSRFYFALKMQTHDGMNSKKLGRPTSHEKKQSFESVNYLL